MANETKKEVKILKEAIKRPEKSYYTVKLEATAPVTLEFRIYAETPEEAADMVGKFPMPPFSRAPRPDLSRMRRIKATVYKYGMSTIDFIKTFIG